MSSNGSVAAEAIALRNARGERRAFVDFARLRDLWFLWTRCNLECTHCYAGSSPRNTRVETPTAEEIAPYLREAGAMGVERVYFTGGEPFAAREILAMIDAALAVAPVTVLTNGVGPIRRYFDELERRRDRLTLRISLDHFERERHDEIRGPGAFQAAVSTVFELSRRGFVPVITVTPVVFERTPVTADRAVEAVQALFPGCEVLVKLLPVTIRTGAEATRRGAPGPVPFLSERAMIGARPDDFQCHTSRCVQKVGGRMRVYPCPIILDDARFDLGATLRESMQRVYLAHTGCVDFCHRFRGRCGDDQLRAAPRGGM